MDCRCKEHVAFLWRKLHFPAAHSLLQLLEALHLRCLARIALGLPVTPWKRCGRRRARRIRLQNRTRKQMAPDCVHLLDDLLDMLPRL